MIFIIYFVEGGVTVFVPYETPVKTISRTAPLNTFIAFIFKLIEEIKNMIEIPKPVLIRFIKYLNQKKICPTIRFGTRQNKPDLIKGIKRYFTARYHENRIHFVPTIRAPRFCYFCDENLFCFEKLGDCLEP